jgi:hypothetical protein
MKTILVVFENTQHWKHCLYHFVKLIAQKEDIKEVSINNGIVKTENTMYQLVGLGFPFVSQGDPVFEKLKGYRFEHVMIHNDVLLTKYAEFVIKSRMQEVKDFEEFDL